MLQWWQERSRRQRAEAERRLEQHRDHIRRGRERMEMASKERSILASLGFELGNVEQCWLRQAQLLAQYREDIADLKARVSAIEGR